MVDELERIAGDTLLGENDTYAEVIIGIAIIGFCIGISLIAVAVLLVTVPIWILPYLIYKSKRGENSE